MMQLSAIDPTERRRSASIPGEIRKNLTENTHEDIAELIGQCLVK